MAEAPKLFTNKPKKGKAQLKQFQEQQKGKDFSSPLPPSSSSSSSSMGTRSSSSQPPPQPPKESFARRYKFLWPMILTVNIAVGAYLFMRTKKKDTDVEEEFRPPVSTSATTVHVVEKPVQAPTIKEPVKLLEPVSEDQQREIFKWVLEEKRKVKPKNPEEKKRIDEEKAILKQFIRAKSIPAI